MNLEEAIKHYAEVYASCASEEDAELHLKLATWLNELKELRSAPFHETCLKLQGPCAEVERLTKQVVELIKEIEECAECDSRKKAEAEKKRLRDALSRLWVYTGDAELDAQVRAALSLEEPK